uniref:ATP synthase F0 subunit 8 n=1 Tax=Cucumaria frondosa TaxID=36326 RepID=UPI0021158F3E|nr:ATP synthase F0 subunit 8 [Cucumaria frondosa]USQ67438.1 ATP synthase F0 subunit 8 [Cucumaria frondosa]
MPQLDLSWFLVNFLLAWSLIFVIWVIINFQTWNTHNTLNNSNNESQNLTQENWNW